MKRAIIFSNGDYNDYSYIKSIIKNDDFIICADGAVRHCVEIGVVPHLWLGDFDSCVFDEMCRDYPELTKCNIVRLKPDKDETDTHVACIQAMNSGCKEILIVGALGKRVDHMMANISMLEYMNSFDINITIEDEKNRISIARKKNKILKKKKYLSIVPLDEYVEISDSEGLLYPLKNEILYRCHSRGISNEITEAFATFEIKNGKALIIESEDRR